MINELQAFAYGSYVGVFSVTTSSVTYKEQNDPNFEAAVGSTLAKFEGVGVSKI